MKASQTEPAIPPVRSGAVFGDALEPRVDCNSGSGLVGAGGVIEWLHSKLAEAEGSLRARVQMEETWRSGTNKSWAAVAKLHPSTAGQPPMKKAERIKAAEAQKRIAVKCRRDVEMFKAVLALVGGGGAEHGDENGAEQSGACSPNDVVTRPRLEVPDAN